MDNGVGHDLYRTFEHVFSDCKSEVNPKTYKDGDNTIEKTQFEYLTAATSSDSSLNKPISERVDIRTLIQEYEKSIEELQLTLSATRSQRKVLAADLSKEKDVKEQLSKVRTALANKLQDQSTRKEPKDSYRLQLEDRVKNAKKQGKELRGSLGAFINKHFPMPTKEVVSEARKKLRSSDRKSEENLVSLKSILEDLVNKCMEDPNDPYIDVDDSIWPPYVELLLRCQIVTRHPDNNAKIKLVPFHL
ncbi:centromere protein K-like [Saccostrea cucullata]|uniref:centromere protein K-like n=1 Tax=Saccostrea cuccullata TaxID=36930 RepID=UPI002ED674D3